MSKKEKDFLSTQLKDINSIFGYDAGELNSRLVQKTYYLYFVLLFALDFLYSLIQINNLSSYDKNMLKSINTKKDILNKEYHKYPLSVAKLLIMYKMIKNRHLIKIRSNIIFLNVLIKDIFGKKNLIIPLDKDLFL